MEALHAVLKNPPINTKNQNVKVGLFLTPLSMFSGPLSPHKPVQSCVNFDWRNQLFSICRIVQKVWCWRCSPPLRAVTLRKACSVWTGTAWTCWWNTSTKASRGRRRIAARSFCSGMKRWTFTLLAQRIFTLKSSRHWCSVKLTSVSIEI